MLTEAARRQGDDGRQNEQDVKILAAIQFLDDDAGEAQMLFMTRIAVDSRRCPESLFEIACWVR